MSYSQFPSFQSSYQYSGFQQPEEFGFQQSPKYSLFYQPPLPSAPPSTPLSLFNNTFNLITYVLVKSSKKRKIKEVVTLSDDDELFNDDDADLFKEKTTFHGYEIYMLKKWSMLTLSNVDIQKSKYGYYIKNLSDEQLKLITDGFVTVHPKLKLVKRELFLRSHPNVKIIDSKGNKDIAQMTGLATEVKIDLQGYKTKNNTILPIWRLKELLYV